MLELELKVFGVKVSKMRNIMLDIETMGNQSYSALISIGAVQFDLKTGDTGKEFHKKIDLQSSLDAGLIINASTIQFWMKQESEAKKSVFEDAIHINEVLVDFAEWLNECQQVSPSKLCIWGNSARFDCGIVQNAYDKCGLILPWDFRYERDVRTLVAFAPEVKRNVKFEGTAHDALDDCKHQIKYCSQIFNKLNIEQKGV